MFGYGLFHALACVDKLFYLFRKNLHARDDPNTYYCVATFTDEAAFEYHMATDFHDRIVPDIVDCLAEEMVLSFYDIIGDPKKGLSRP